jgi:hypothetical protein
MKTVLNPRWLLVVNTLPLFILFLLYFGAYKIINTLLTEENITAWIEVGSSLLVLAIANLIYTFWAILKRQQVSVIYAVTAIFAYITFLYLYDIQADNIIPRSIPRWMLPTNMIVYVGTFVMPTLTHALLCLIVHSTTKQEEEQGELLTHSSNYNLLAYILPPILWFSLFMLIIPFWKPMGLRNIEQHILVVVAIIGIVAFMFLVGRTVYVVTVKRVKSWQEYSVGINIIVGIFLPLGALLLNKTLDNLFGNYESEWFYILAACNGVILSLPELEKPTYRLGLFMARSLSYPFIVYFFLIFLPYAPFSFPLLLALGLGFLLLLPMILMILQTNVMRTDFQYLFAHFPKKFVYTIFGLGILVMPLSITFAFWQEKQALYQALDYVYEPNLAQKDEEIDKVDAKDLADVLMQVRQNKEGNRGWKNNDIPFISMYYNWLVLDNMTLDETKIRHLESIFLGTPTILPNTQNWQQNNTDSTKITKITTNTTYDSIKKQYRTWIDLEIKDQRVNTADWRQGEFETVFELPAGVYISDYYLWIGEEKVFGILAEKKAAMWVYRQITATRRDPGILNYVAGNKIRFRVFPFAVGELRKTGIEVLHKEPLIAAPHPLTPSPSERGNKTPLPIGEGQGVGSILLTEVGFTSGAGRLAIFSYDKKAAYLSATFKQTLPKVKRNPYLHFIIDGSEKGKSQLRHFGEVVNEIIKTNPNLATNVKITFANAYSKSIDFTQDWQKNIAEQTFEGGFYAERAIEKIYYEQRKNITNSYPILVILASEKNHIILNKDFTESTKVIPEMPNYFLYLPNDAKKLETYNFDNQSITDSTQAITQDFLLKTDLQEVFAWTHENKTYYLKNDSTATIVNLENDKPFHTEFTEKDWLSGLTLEGQYQTMLQNPHTTEDLWLKLVKGSFDTKIMTPLTSYISLENEAQRQALLYKQQQVLNSKKSLDIPEPDNFQSMSEPSWWVCAIILLALLRWKKLNIFRIFFNKSATKQ